MEEYKPVIAAAPFLPYNANLYLNTWIYLYISYVWKVILFFQMP